MWEIRVIDLGAVEIDASRTVQTGSPGRPVRVPVQSFLLLGPGGPVVVDTGFRDPAVLGRIGMRAFEEPWQRLGAQLARYGVPPSDVTAVIQTHLHIDHAGQTDLFPMSVPVVLNRRELEYSVSGLSGASYPPEDVKHIIDRLHAPGALRLLDLELTGGEVVLPGLRCVAAGGHTEGSLVIYVETADGLACICGDIVYDVRAQLCAPTLLAAEPVTSGNYVTTRRAERAAIKRVLNSGARMLYPSHDGPARLEDGRATPLEAPRPPGGGPAA